MKTNFNHNSSSLLDGMGFSEEQANNLEKRVNVIANKTVHEQLAQTKVAEILAEELSEIELLYMATIGMREMIVGRLDKMSSKSRGRKTISSSSIPQLDELDAEALEDLSNQGMIDIGDGVSFKIVKASSEQGRKLMDLLDPDGEL